MSATLYSHAPMRQDREFRLGPFAFARMFDTESKNEGLHVYRGPPLGISCRIRKRIYLLRFGSF